MMTDPYKSISVILDLTPWQTSYQIHELLFK